MKRFFILIVLFSLILVSCDDRGSENPSMYVEIDQDYDGFIYNKIGFNEVTFTAQLDGPLSKIVERRINVEITNDVGYFIGSGSSQSMITDQQGFSQGRYVAQDGYGEAHIEFVLETWPQETAVYNINIIDFPKIDSLTTDNAPLVADGQSSTEITAHISSANADLETIKILFETSDGELLHDQVYADADGKATTTLIAPNQPGNITVRARLAILPTTLKTIYILCENP